ncbi:MAG: hypothetical protein MUE44_35295 [Oscillatoriaceae cyanobacterium Prado104]|jgi:hypothetical protein|nr:hypothetical protein [Oscillatoriaceae cyanobacterium Prado104]
MANLQPPEFKADRNDRPTKPPSILSATVTLIISATVIFLANTCFGVFASIIRPLSFLELIICIVPATLIGAIAINKLFRDVKYLLRNYSKLVLVQVSILVLSLLLLVLGISKSFYHMNPVNNFRAYIPQREQVVSLIRSKQLKVDGFTKTAKADRATKVNLPERYHELSRNGQVSAIGEGNSLEVIFTHSNIGFFGDGVNYIIYRSDGDPENISVIPDRQRPPLVKVKQLKIQWYYVKIVY